MKFQIIFSVYFFTFCAIKAADFDLFFRHDTKKVNTGLINVTNSIIENIFLKSFSEVNFIYFSEKTESAKFFYFKDALLKAKGNFTAFRIFSHKNINDSKLEKKKNVVVLVDTFSDLNPLLKSIKTKNFDVQGYFLFVLVNDIMNKNQRVILHGMMSLRFMNTNVVYSENENTTIIRSFQPFNAKSCGNVFELILAKFTGGDFKGNWNDLYPVKTKNFHGCTLRVAIPDEWPSAYMYCRD